LYNLTDLHLHTRFSWDAQQTMEELAEKAAKENMSYICLTEHIDLMDEHKHNYTKFDYKSWSSAAGRNRRVFPGLRKGIEAGEVHDYSDRFKRFIEGKDLDYIIGSVHSVGDFTPVYDEYFSQYDSMEEAYKHYFEEEFKLIKHGGFDVAAHLTLVHRQGGRRFKKPVYESFKHEINDLLKLMVSNKIGIEVNTSGLDRFPAKDFIPDEETIKAYLWLGGDIITVGSDSHKLSDSFSGIKKAYEMLERIGVREVTVFDKRMPVKVAIRTATP
jgi:histidinol-phosphatase (PHP family)